MRCPFGLIIGDYFFCTITIDKDGAAKQIRGDLYGVKKQDWCPLRPLPEKCDTKMTGADWNCGYNDGWNACVDEIIIRSKSPEEIIKYYENKNIQIKRKAAQEAQTSALTTPLEKPLSNAMFNGMLWKIV